MNIKIQLKIPGLFLALLFFQIGFYAQGAIIFSKADSPHMITEDYIVENYDTIIFEAGSVVIVSPYVSIITNGVVMMEGTANNPISILPEVEVIGWGKIDIVSNGTSYFSHVSITDGSLWSKFCNMTLDHVVFNNTQNLPWNNPILFVRNASVDINNSSIFGNYTGEGFQMLNSEEVVVKNCYFNRIPDAVELTNIVGGHISKNWFDDIPDDGIDLNNCTNTLIDSNIIINAYDRGIEIGSENNGNSENILVKRNVLIDCDKGITFKEESFGQVINNTFYGNNIGLSCIADNAPRSGSFANIQNCIFSNSVEMDVYNDSNSIVNIEYCLSDTDILQGNNNIHGNPMFIDVSDYNFNLQGNSPCINAGNPELPLDSDSSISDIGAFFFNPDTTIINDQKEAFQSIKIFPNPFDDNFVISWFSAINSSVSVKLFDIYGSMISINNENDQASIQKTIRIIPVDKLKSNMVVICNISINDKSKSYLLIHK